MRSRRLLRRCLTWLVATVVVAIALLAILVAAIDGGFGRNLLIRGFAWTMGRSIQVTGPLEARLFSLNPRVSARGVRIGNPAWMPPGLTAEMSLISAVLKLPSFSHPAGIVGLDVQGATLYLVRHADGRANWQLHDPAREPPHTNSPILRSVAMPDAHVLLHDELRHLDFDGIVSASNRGGVPATQPVLINGTGQLNGKTASFELRGEPLSTATHHAPYHFTFSERSGQSRLEAQGALPQPFAFDIVDAQFHASGPDLKDLYYLTGIHLLDTGRYQLSGSAMRRGPQTRFDDLVVTTGDSDMRGSVAIDHSQPRPRFDLDLHSQFLKLSDLGLRAAGRTTAPKPSLLLSDARLSPNVLHLGEVLVRFRAQRLEIGRLSVDEITARATIDHGLLTVASLRGRTLAGTLDAHGQLDGRTDPPTAHLDLTALALQIALLSRKDPEDPPAEGPLKVQVQISGRGYSAHQVAETANGTVHLQLPSGALRKSFAELAGIDLRGLGLLLTKSKKDVAIRCAVADFKAHEGTLDTHNLLVDSEPVLITGEGQIHLDTGALDLQLRGHPKHPRVFRVQAPVLVQGTLAHPAFHVSGKGASLVVIDPGHTPNADCTELLRTAARPASDTP